MAPKYEAMQRGDSSQATSDQHGAQAWTAAASRSAFQVQGNSRASSFALVWPETMRSSTSGSQPKGSAPFSMQLPRKRHRQVKPQGDGKRRNSLEPQIYAAALAPVISAQIANVCARTAR